MSLLGIEKKYSRAFDLILIPGFTNLEQIISLDSIDDITLVELKTTKKKLINNPSKFFFGATESEFELTTQLGDKYKFCFVSLHPETLNYKLLTLQELNKVIITKISNIKLIFDSCSIEDYFKFSFSPSTVGGVPNQAS